MDASLSEIEEMARAAVDALPLVFRPAARAVLLRVEEMPEPDVLRDLEIDDPLELTGMYDGVPMPFKSLSDPDVRPDVVWIYRLPILDEWRERGDVALCDLVAHVVVHEFAHHFGWSDEDIAVIDRWWE